MNFTNVLKLARKHVRGQLWLLAACLVLILFEGLVGSLALATLIPITSILVNGSGSMEQSLAILSWLPIDISDVGPKILLFLALLLFLKFFISLARTVSSILLGEKLKAKWVGQMLDKVLVSPIDRYGWTEEGAILSNVLDLPRGSQNFVVGMTGFISILAQSAAIIVVMLAVNWQVLAAGTVLMLVLYLLAHRPYTRIAQKFGQRNIKYHQDIAALVSETIRNIRDIKLLNLLKLSSERVQTQLDGHMRLQFKTRVLQAVPTQFVELLFAAIVLSIYFLISGIPFEQVRLLLPTAAFFIVGAQRVSAFAASLAAIYFKLATNFQRFELMDQLLTAADETDGKKGASVPLLTQKIDFKDVSYTYDRGSLALHDITVSIPLGKIVFFIGKSGSGKSTLMDMITRLREPSEGVITADGHPINQCSQQSWWRLFGYVSQEPTLLNGTFAENISLFDDRVSHGDIVRAAKLAGGDEFIERDPKGYEKQISRSGGTLSGGQKRRIAIARCLLRQPQMLILDEALSALDEQVERELIQSLSEIEGLSLFIVTHRTANMDLADTIFEMEDGKVAQRKLVGSKP